MNELNTTTHAPSATRKRATKSTLPATTKRHRHHATAAFLKLADFGPVYNVSGSTARRLRKEDPTFPQPVRIGAASNSPLLFRRADLDRYFGVSTTPAA